MECYENVYFINIMDMVSWNIKLTKILQSYVNQQAKTTTK